MFLEFSGFPHRVAKMKSVGFVRFDFRFHIRSRVRGCDCHDVACLKGWNGLLSYNHRARVSISRATSETESSSFLIEKLLLGNIRSFRHDCGFASAHRADDDDHFYLLAHGVRMAWL